MTAPNQTSSLAADAVPASGADLKTASAPLVERPLTQFRAQLLSLKVNGRDVTVQAPARFAQFSNYEIAVRRAAPALSEHTLEVLTEMAGLSAVEVQALFAQGVI